MGINENSNFEEEDDDSENEETERILQIAYDTTISEETRIHALEEAFKEEDPSDYTTHESLVELIYRFDNEIANKAAALIGECYNFDMEHLEELQLATVDHISHKVRRTLLDSLEEISKSGLDEESCGYMLEDRVIDTSKYFGYPDEYDDKDMPRATRQREKKWDLFISYASEQRATILKPLVDKLKTLGISFWVDVDGTILGGTGIREKLFEALDHSRYFCAIISKEYITKYWTCRELKEMIALTHYKAELRFIPLLYDMSLDTLKSYKAELNNSNKILTNSEQILFPTEFGQRLTEMDFDWMTALNYMEVKETNLAEIAGIIKLIIDQNVTPSSKNGTSSTNGTKQLKESNDEALAMHKQQRSKKNDLFASYAIENRNTILKQLIEGLDYKGITVWDYDKNNLEIEMSRKDIFEVIDHANCLCVIISKDYVNNHSLVRELDEMRKLYQFVNFPVFPLLFDITIEEVTKAISIVYFGDKELNDWLKKVRCSTITNGNIMEIVEEIKKFVVKGLSRFA